jgi:DNA-binding transcriptional ArsR family regulator
VNPSTPKVTHDAVFDALGDPTRRAILELLAERPRHVAELARGMPISRSAVSQQLKILRECQFVRVQEQGTRRLYRIDPAGVEEARRYLDQLHNRDSQATNR